MKKIIFLFCLVTTSCAELNKAVVFTDETTGRKQLQQREFYQPLNSDTTKPEDVGAPMERLLVESKGARIKINGTTYIDQSGAISEIATHSDTGYITYLRPVLDRGYQGYDVILDKPFKTFSKKTIASITPISGRYQISIPKHEDRVATRYALTSQGVILFHAGGLFSYVSENYVSDVHTIPEGFGIAAVQADDISKANYLAFMRDNGPIKVGFVTVGGYRQYEVIFVDIKTGVVRASEMVRVENTSDQSFNESFHRMLKVSMTNQGFIVCNLEANYKNLFVSNLHTGKRKSLVFRENGISNFEIGKDTLNTLWLRSVYGSNDERYFPDVALELTK